jgi:hypothetical protein
MRSVTEICNTHRDTPVVFLVILRPAVIKERLRFIVAVPATCVPTSTVVVALFLRHVVPFVRVLAAGLQRPLRCAHLVCCASELGSWRVGMLPHRVVEVARVVAILRISSWNHVRTLFWIPLLKGRQFIYKYIQSLTETFWARIPHIKTRRNVHIIMYPETFELQLNASMFCHVGLQATTSEISSHMICQNY